MAPLEPWEKVIIDPEVFLATVHGQIPCTDCHLGNNEVSEKDAAHEGLIARPSDANQDVCSDCHSNVTDVFAVSLHSTQSGYFTMFEARGLDPTDPNLNEMFTNHCSSCHSSCGDCHVSQPESVGGGLIDNHIFNATPSLTRNCTACHGSRVGNEYLGKNEDVMADVHFRQARMSCVDCHTADNMHGNYDLCTDCHEAVPEGEIPVDHRYGGMQEPACTDCHQIDQDSENTMHTVHGENLSCQVCHSVSYTSCDGCHVALSEETGAPFFATDGSYMTFYIGLNPYQDAHRPYEYVTLRHIPVAMDSFTFYGDELEADLIGAPTWTYATPHNIQLQTPQNESCESCHGNADIFLTADKVNADELESNLQVIVDTIPSLELLISD